MSIVRPDPSAYFCLKRMTEVAELAGVTRASLYKSLSDDGNPEFATTAKVVQVLGYKLTIS